MFWIVGGDTLGRAVAAHLPDPWNRRLAAQLEHVAWEGFRFYDLIFPLFLFVVGVVLPFSLSKYGLGNRDRRSAWFRLGRRTLALFLLGLIYNGLLQFQLGELRYCGVLQRIAIAYFFAAIAVMTCAIRGQILLTVILLGGYWAILQYVPVPGGAAGVLTPEGNLSGYLDRTLLPGKILPQYYGHGDNEGILSTIPAVATTLLGVLAGHWLRSGRRAVTTVAGLVVTGVAFVWLGWFWHSSFPVIKNLWTSSFVLVAGGYSLLLLAAFYTVIDVLGFRLWAFFFIVIGVNAITIYVAQRIIDFPKIAEFFVGGVARYSGDYRLVVMAAATLLLKWLFLWFLYQKQVFLRV